MTFYLPSEETLSAAIYDVISEDLKDKDVAPLYISELWSWSIEDAFGWSDWYFSDDDDETLSYEQRRNDVTGLLPETDAQERLYEALQRWVAGFTEEELENVDVQNLVQLIFERVVNWQDWIPAALELDAIEEYAENAVVWEETRREGDDEEQSAGIYDPTDSVYQEMLDKAIQNLDSETLAG